MYQRQITPYLKKLAKQYPIVTITGPRQSGKTTLARMAFPGLPYLSLEDPDIRAFAETDARGFLANMPTGAILDEIQRVPSLFSYLQTDVDLNPKAGRYVLTGSHQFLLNNKISQTLSGRTALLRLLPCSLSEILKRPPQTFWESKTILKTKPPRFSLSEILWKGLYPRVHDSQLSPTQFYRDYVETYVTRDVQELLAIGDLKQFHTFLRLLAGRAGQLVNLTSLGNDAGVSHTTVKRWLSVLEAGFVIYLLPPHFKNFHKRLVKSPKIYFLDPGLLCYLLRIRTPEELPFHASIGAIFENFVFSEIYKSFCHRSEEAPLYFWRDLTGNEIDFLLDKGKEFLPIEVKSAQTLSSSFFGGLQHWMKLPRNATTHGHLVFGGDSWQERSNVTVWPWYGVS